MSEPPEKNIVVNRGIPLTPSVSGEKGGSYSNFSPGGGGHYADDHHAGDNSFGYMDEWESRNMQTQTAYAQRLLTIPQVIETELMAIRAQGPTNPVAPVEAAARELAVRDALIAFKTTEANEQENIANTFFGSDPSSKSVDEWMRLYNAGKDPAKLLADWTTSLSAAYTAKFINEEIKVLNNQSITVKETLATAQAKEAEAQRRAAEAEAKRIANEQARVAAEAEAQRVAAEQARIAAAQQAQRLAAEAEAKRVADERARVAAEAEAQRVAAEQARIAAEQEAQRLAAEVEAKRVADEHARVAAEAEAQRVAAEQARIAAEVTRIANTFRAPGQVSAAQPLFMTSSGTIAAIEGAAITLQAATRAGLAALGGFIASTATGFFVGVTALFYSSKLANGELPERYAFSMPLSDLAPDHGQNAATIAAVGGTIDLPFRISSKTAADGQSEIFVVKTDGGAVPSKVRVVAATYNAEQNVYTATTADTPSRTLTWTPIVTPGNSSTALPAEHPVPPVYTGATVTPVEGRVDTFPAVSEASFDDFITVFPADSGLPPIYAMFRDRREDEGIATGNGHPVSGIWLGAASHGEGAPIPSQIADQLRGKEFKNFREFRESLWKAVGNDQELSKQFKTENIANMMKGKAPASRKADRVGGRVKFEIHHKVYISNGGTVYDIDNIAIVTSKRHIEIHKEGKQDD